MGSYTCDASFEFPESKSGNTSNNSSSVNAKELSVVCGEQIMKLASSNPKKPAGRKKFKETRHPVYRGIRSRNSGKWVCEVRKPRNNTRLWLGTHLTAEMAARAHDVAAIALRGPAACINFADSTWRLPSPASSDDKDIQKAASEASEAFRPQKTIENPDEIKVRLIVMYMEDPDDEELFGLPAGYMSYMAEGMMMRPLPRYLERNGDHVEPPTDDVSSLWSYPF